MDTKKKSRSQRIIDARIAKKWDQPRLALEVGVTKGAVNKWESHKLGSPNIDLAIFYVLADKLGLDPRELAIGEKKKADGVPPLSHEDQLLMEQISKVPVDISLPIRAMVNAVFLAGSEKYATWSRKKDDEVKRRDAPQKEKA